MTILQLRLNRPTLQRGSIPDIALNRSGINMLHTELFDFLDAQQAHAGFCFGFEDCGKQCQYNTT